MLSKIINSELKSFEKKIEIPGGYFINTEIIFKNEFSGRKALYIHGGGIYGDHTLAARPAEWLIHNEVFDVIILPDRIGSGKSSPLTKPITIKEQSEEMKLLLDVMDINEKITVIGASYGGLVSLLLADIDERVEKVILMGSSPTLQKASFGFRFTGKTGILKNILKFIVWVYAGKCPPKYVNQDEFYDLKTFREYRKMAVKILSHISRNELRSMYFKIDSLMDKQNYSIPPNIRMDIPIFQVIGENDEFWRKDIPDIYIKNFPLLSRSVIPQVSHRDIILKADLFHNEVIRFLKKN